MNTMGNTGTLLYRCPGANHGPGGHMYDWIPSSSEAETNALLKEGWFPTLDEAVKADVVHEDAPVGATPIDPSLTPEERVLAAKRALASAAERALAANKAYTADAQAVAAADVELNDATLKAQGADAERDAAASTAVAAAADKVRIANRVQALNRTLNLSKAHVEAARHVLDDAAAQMLAANQLLAETAAAEEALAAAGRKSIRATDQFTAVNRVTGKATLDDVKAALTKLKDEVNAKAVTKLLKQFNVAAAPELSEDKYAEVLVAVEKELY